MDPPKFWTFRDLISEKGDFVILVRLLWPPWNENPNRASKYQAIHLLLFNFVQYKESSQVVTSKSNILFYKIVKVFC